MVINGNNSVEWDAVPGAIDYDIEVLNAAAGATLSTYESVDTSISAPELLSNLSPGNYNVRVRGRDAVGPGDWSAILPIEYAGLPAPGNVRVV